MVDDALLLVSIQGEPPEVGLVETLSGSLYCWVSRNVIWKFVLMGGARCAIPT